MSLCPVDDRPLPPYRFGRPPVYCSVPCRRLVECTRADLGRLRERVAYEEMRADDARRRRGPNLDTLERFAELARHDLEAAVRLVSAADAATGMVR